MTSCFFVTDLHGRPARFESLFERVEREPPAALFIGGDILPHAFSAPEGGEDFLREVVLGGLGRLRDRLGSCYPRVFVIPGNDDPRAEIARLTERDASELCTWLHGERALLAGRTVLGYGCVPPTPFQLKDWERYDVSRYVDPGCVSPEEGRRSVAVDAREARWSTIADDLERLAGDGDLSDALVLFHAPPHDTPLDLADLAGQSIDHVPLDPHVGSIAVRRFIESRQPAVTLHGHVHESSRLSGTWRTCLGRTECFNAAHEGSELALVRFDLADPRVATRELIWESDS